MSEAATILLVDDHAIVRQGVKMILEGEADFKVVGEASEKKEAVEKAAALQPKIIVMDLDLAGTDGLAASREILAAQPGSKVIILSAEASPESVQKALQVGVAGYVVKESVGEELIRAIRTVLSGRFYLCPEITTAVIRAQNLQQSAPPIPLLTERDKELLRLISGGHRNKEIAEKLSLSIKSIEANRSKLMHKLGCTSAAELVRYAIREGIAAP
ncbi:MAG: response regulator transcription factor [Nibricoccus sp.]